MAIKERPKNFKAWEVLAIRDDRKTQFREIIKNQPFLYKVYSSETGRSEWYGMKGSHNNTPESWLQFCPYKVGDRIWGKETWQKLETWVEYGTEFYDVTEKDSFGSFIEYKATNESGWNGKWKQSTQMRREYSRILLEITDIRVEILGEITEEDAIAEGVEKTEHGFKVNEYCSLTACDCFSTLQDYLYGNDYWETNKDKWFWVVTFKRIA